ncbi:MAG: hypothetical protein HZB30_10580 [Nitrospirae bacterium]|nr:hypothetical protein [Nitrospirota bacterium]
MFKLIFRTIFIIVFVIFISIGIAVWKGGEPFRWLGEKTVTTGKIIQRLGDYIDDVKAGSHKIKKTYEEIKDTVSPEKHEDNRKSK